MCCPGTYVPIIALFVCRYKRKVLFFLDFMRFLMDFVADIAAEYGCLVQKGAAS